MHLSTIGYEGKDIQYFIALLKREGITALIDVREKPFSRKKGFSKNKLQEALSIIILRRWDRLPGCVKRSK